MATRSDEAFTQAVTPALELFPDEVVDGDFHGASSIRWNLSSLDAGRERKVECDSGSLSPELAICGRMLAKNSQGSLYRSPAPCTKGTIMMTGVMPTIFEAAGGNDGLHRLAQAWHRRVMADDVVSHAFSHGFHPEHVDRLAAYWAEALGGPTTYSESYGNETTVVRMHSGNGEHGEMDRRAIACFDQALVDVGLAGDNVLRQVLHDYFAWATTTTMSRYHYSVNDVPSGLSIPHWSWDGLVV